jgi:hypothetical protein
LSGVQLFRWMRLDLRQKETLWKYYGVFCGLMCFGCCIGVAAWSTNIPAFSNYVTFWTNYEMTFKATLDPRVTSQYRADEVLLFFATSLNFTAARLILCSLESLFLSLVKLVVLDRMQEFSSVLQKYSMAKYATTAIVVIGCIVSVGGSIASAVYLLDAASLAVQASSAIKIPPGLSSKAQLAVFQSAYALYVSSQSKLSDAKKVESVDEISQMCVLLILVCLFLVAGAFCAARLRSFMDALLAVNVTAHQSNSSVHVKQVFQQIMITISVVLVTFLPRATFASLEAVSGVLQDFENGLCAEVCADEVSKTCLKVYNRYSKMVFYFQFTPEYQLIVNMLSSPVCLMVALWGMTSERMRQVMSQAGQRELRTIERSSSQ